MMCKVKKISFTIVFVSLLVIVTVLIAEIAATLLLNNSSIVKGSLLKAFRSYHSANDRRIIQYLQDCALYDNDLSYILKPGTCRIKNREFEVYYHINTAGVRDDEVSLIAPEVVVIGDSHAMGWGVSQDEIFSSLLENAAGKSVLNASISSYGTVRELKILERINLKQLKYLIIQYCSNDYQENKVFMGNNGKLPIMTKEKYGTIVEDHKHDTEYYLGKHSYNIVSILFRKFAKLLGTPRSTSQPKKMVADEVAAFLYAISNSHLNLTNVKIVVFEVNGYARNDSLFINELNATIQKQAYLSSARNIQAIDFSTILGKEKYFHLDDHINNLGHQAIADNLGQLINETTIVTDHGVNQ